MRLRWVAPAALPGAAYGPSVTALRPIRRLLAPGLSATFVGKGRPGHVALTYDDGPNAASTPAFLDLLARHDRRATFFLLGDQLWIHRDLVASMAAAGHELAVHGWDHTCVATKRPGVLYDEVRRAKEMIEDLSGSPVRWYRPPYGISTAESLHAARRSDLRTVLWSAWGRDWERQATPASITRTVQRQLGTGGTVLLHDTDRTSAKGSWRATLDASDALLSAWHEAGVVVGPLREHFDASSTGPARRLSSHRHTGAQCRQAAAGAESPPC